MFLTGEPSPLEVPAIFPILDPDGDSMLVTESPTYLSIQSTIYGCSGAWFRKVGCQLKR